MDVIPSRPSSASSGCGSSTFLRLPSTVWNDTINVFCRVEGISSPRGRGHSPHPKVGLCQLRRPKRHSSLSPETHRSFIPTSLHLRQIDALWPQYLSPFRATKPSGTRSSEQKKPFVHARHWDEKDLLLTRPDGLSGLASKHAELHCARGGHRPGSRDKDSLSSLDPIENGPGRRDYSRFGQSYSVSDRDPILAQQAAPQPGAALFHTSGTSSSSANTRRLHQSDDPRTESYIHWPDRMRASETGQGSREPTEPRNISSRSFDRTLRANSRRRSCGDGGLVREAHPPKAIEALRHGTFPNCAARWRAGEKAVDALGRAKVNDEAEKRRHRRRWPQRTAAPSRRSSRTFEQPSSGSWRLRQEHPPKSAPRRITDQAPGERQPAPRCGGWRGRVEMMLKDALDGLYPAATRTRAQDVRNRDLDVDQIIPRCSGNT